MNPPTISDEAIAAELNVLSSALDSTYESGHHVQLAINFATEKLRKKVAYEEDVVRCAGLQIQELREENRKLKEEVEAQKNSLWQLENGKYGRGHYHQLSEDLQKHLTALREALQQTSNHLYKDNSDGRHSELFHKLQAALSSTPAELQKMFVRREEAEKAWEEGYHAALDRTLDGKKTTAEEQWLKSNARKVVEGDV